MPRISAERMQHREASLVAAARQVFAAKGYESAAISDIARAAGVSDGLLYRYFGSKRDLLLAVLDDFYLRLIDDLERDVASCDDFEGKLATLIRSHVEVFVRDIDLCRLVITEIRNFTDYAGSGTRDLNRRYTSILLRVLAHGVDEGRVSPDFDGRIVRDMLFGGIEHIAWRHLVAGQSLNVDQCARQIYNLLIGGLSSWKD